MLARTSFVIVVLAPFAVCAGPHARAGEPLPAPPSARVRAAGLDTLTFRSLVGSPSQELSIEIARDAGGALPIPVAHVTYDPPVASWLSWTISGDGRKRMARLRATPFGLSERPGVYTAAVAFTLPGKTPAAVTVPVSLQVMASSGAVCPRGSTLRYEGGGDGRGEPRDFGRNFFAAFCIGCHAAPRLGAARNGAPANLNWDTISGVRAQLGWIDRAAAAGPHGVHSDMPPSGLAKAFPTEEDRRRLGMWIACGAP